MLKNTGNFVLLWIKYCLVKFANHCILLLFTFPITFQYLQKRGCKIYTWRVNKRIIILFWVLVAPLTCAGLKFMDRFLSTDMVTNLIFFKLSRSAVSSKAAEHSWTSTDWSVLLLHTGPGRWQDMARCGLLTGPMWGGLLVSQVDWGTAHVTCVGRWREQACEHGEGVGSQWWLLPGKACTHTGPVACCTSLEADSWWKQKALFNSEHSSLSKTQVSEVDGWQNCCDPNRNELKALSQMYQDVNITKCYSKTFF